MVTSLPPNTPEEQDDLHNPAKKLYDAEFNASTGSASGKSAKSGAEASANDPTSAVRNGEKSKNAFDYDPTGKSDRNSSSKSFIRPVSILKRGSPMALIIGILIGFGALSFGSFSLLPVHLYQNFMEKYDSNNTSYTLRTNKVLVNKLVEKGTEGECTFTKIICRFSRPSDFMLKQLALNNITPLDKNKTPIEKRLLGPNNRPKYYAYTDSNGKTIAVAAADLQKTLANTPEFRAAFHGALKTRLQVFSDSVFKAVAKKYGFTKQDTSAKATNEEAVNKNVKEATRGTSVDADETGIKDNIRTNATKETGKLAKSGMGNGFGVVAGGVCLVGDIPGIVTRTARAYQMAQLVRFGVIFMTTVGALKAGDATPQEVSATNNSLTQIVNGKSALDSFGIKYTLDGDTAPPAESNYKNYVPGGAVAAALGGIALIMDSAAKKDICSVATSPVTGLAIDAALGPETLGAVPIINAVIGTVAALGIAAVAPPLIELILNSIPPEYYKKLGEVAFGDVTKNLAGENYGDGLASGVANSLGQLANGGANAPMTVEQAVAYNTQTQAVNVAYAEEDRATLSPLDGSNKNTMMGAFVEKLIPLYSQMGSLTSMLSSIGSIASTSASTIFIGKTYAATDPSAQYKLCDDPTLVGADGKQIAAGPFCNIQYGIPTEYLDMDPQQIVQDLVDAKQIDEETGEAIPDAPIYQAIGTVSSALGIPEGSQITSYYDWLQTCTDGTSDQATNCQINNKQIAEYALYTIDHRIQKNIDNQDTAPATAASSSSNVSGSKQELAKAILDSGKLSFTVSDGISSATQKKIFSDIAEGKTDGNSTPCGLNIKVLQAIKAVTDNHQSVSISDTNSYCTGLNIRRVASRHYGGNGSAVDFTVLDGVSLNGKNEKSIGLIKELYPLMSKGTSIANESQVGQDGDNCRPKGSLDLPGVSQFGDSCNHVHIDFPTSADPNLKTVPGTNAN